MDELIKQLDAIQSGFEKFSSMAEVAQTAMDKFNVSLNQSNAEKIAELAKQSSSFINKITSTIGKLASVAGDIRDVFYNSLLEPVLNAFSGLIESSGGLITVLENIVNIIVSNADPIIQIVSIIATLVGEGLALAIQTVSDGVAKLSQWLIELIGPLTENQALMDALIIVFASLAAGILLYEAYVSAATIATKAAAIATNAWATAQGVFNAIASLNPVSLIIGGIIALIALIGYVIYKTDGWGAQWQVLVQFMKNSWEVVKGALTYAWLEIENAFMSGYDTIMKGWYKVKSLWDEDSAAKGLANLNNEAAKRAEDLASTKNKLDNAIQATKDGWSWKLTWNDKSLGDMISDTKKVLGISDKTLVPAPAEKTGKKSDLNIASDNIAANAPTDTGKSITINIQKLVDQVNVYQESLSDSVKDLQEQITDALINALNKVQTSY